MLRNLRASFWSRFPQALAVALTVGLLFLGNSLLDAGREGLRQTYVEGFTGDLSVSTRSDEEFTLFGSDLPLIGEYVVTPPLPSPERWKPVVEPFLGHARLLPQVSASGFVVLPKADRVAAPVFGVDVRQYFEFFPALKLVRGSLKSPVNGLWLNESQVPVWAEALGHEPAIGESFDIGMTVRGSFVIRVVTLAGIFQTPGADPVLERTLLVDPDTARALNGYTLGAVSTGEVRPAARRLLTTDLDSLFEDSQDTSAASDNGLSLSDAEKSLADTAQRDEANRALEGSWNFLLLKGADASLAPRLQRAFDTAGLAVQVRDWAATAGGTATVVRWLQLLFSVGMGLVVFVAVLIVMNSVALSVGERTAEIGTWRALGASKPLVGLAIGLETGLLVWGAAVVGLLLAGLGAGVGSFSVSNPVLVTLLGGTVVRPRMSVELWIGHLAAVLAFALAACWLPVKRALEVGPIEAIAREGQ